MQVEELRLVFAANLINLRTEAGMTQAELGAKLNYSDKTISKWERADAIPDAFVLKQMSEIFGVTVDNLLTSHNEWKPIPTGDEPVEEKVYSTGRIIEIVFIGVWTLALTAFVALWLAGIILWQIFAVALPVSLLTVLVMQAVFHRREYIPLTIGAFVFSLFLAAFLLAYPQYKPWQLFLIAVPAELLVYLSCNIHTEPKKLLKSLYSTNRRVKEKNG